jgi:hypothetical protein
VLRAGLLVQTNFVPRGFACAGKLHCPTNTHAHNPAALRASAGGRKTIEGTSEWHVEELWQTMADECRGATKRIGSRAGECAPDVLAEKWAVFGPLANWR